MIKAVFLDVDGTLVSFRTHEVPRSAVGALRAAHARGVRLFIATGRTAGDLEPLAGIPYDGVAALNGSCCVASDGRVVSRSPIPRAPISNGPCACPTSWASPSRSNWMKASSSIA